MIPLQSSESSIHSSDKIPAVLKTTTTELILPTNVYIMVNGKLIFIGYEHHQVFKHSNFTSILAFSPEIIIKNKLESKKFAKFHTKHRNI